MSFKRAKHLAGEDGFTLPEMLVTIMIMTLVLFALYSIFDMSIRVFTFGNDKIESAQNARVALERMEREIRAAYPCTDTAGDPILNGAATNSSRITFCNKPGAAAPVTISYYVSGGNLVRQEAGGTASPLTALGAGGSLEFKYFDKTTGAEITTPSTANVGTIGMVRIKLVVDQDGREQELITNAALRNRTP